MHQPQILGFTCDRNPLLFQKYLSLKYRVFIEEMGWDKLPNLPDERVVLEDPQDRHSHFLIALSDAGDPIGIVRGTLRASFESLYRHELYDDFLHAACVQRIEGRVSTINAIAVLPEFRRSGPAAQNRYGQESEPISDLLMITMISLLSEFGSLLIVLSAIEGGALSLMKRMGFRTVNPPHEFHGPDYSSKPDAKTLRIYDMAKTLVGNSDTYVGRTNRSASDQSLIQEVDAYIRERETNLGPL